MECYKYCQLQQEKLNAIHIFFYFGSNNFFDWIKIMAWNERGVKIHWLHSGPSFAYYSAPSTCRTINILSFLACPLEIAIILFLATSFVWCLLSMLMTVLLFSWDLRYFRQLCNFVYCYCYYRYLHRDKDLSSISVFEQITFNRNRIHARWEYSWHSLSNLLVRKY